MFEIKHELKRVSSTCNYKHQNSWMDVILHYDIQITPKINLCQRQYVFQPILWFYIDTRTAKMNNNIMTTATLFYMSLFDVGGNIFAINEVSISIIMLSSVIV